MSRVVAQPESFAKLVALLAKVPHFDKDERYMAVLGEPRATCPKSSLAPRSPILPSRQTSKLSSSRVRRSTPPSRKNCVLRFLTA